MNRTRLGLLGTVAGLLLLVAISPAAPACTGITLRGQDGSVLYGRTMEWGAFYMDSDLLRIPRGHKFVGETPDGKPGYTWTTKYGAIGVNCLHKELILDGMNETGLTVGIFYHPGYAKYETYVPALASTSIGPSDVAKLLLTSCQSVAEARALLAKVHVTPVVEPALGVPPPVHLMLTEPSGKQIVIEFIDGITKIYDAPLGVITNAPTYDWHLTNLRNYVNLSAVGVPDKKLEELDLKPLGAGSGMIGLPGDFTPPSRFIRAVAFTQSARKTKGGTDTLYEMFRILDNFNVPLGAAEGSAATPDSRTVGMVSATEWTVVYDTQAKVLYYHTQYNRRVRKLDIGAIDFASLPAGIKAIPMDPQLIDDIQDINFQ